MIQVADNLFLKPITLDHAPAIFGIIDSQRQYLREWLPFIDYSKTVADTEKFIRSIPPDHDNETFVIAYDNTIVGIIGFRDTEMNNKRTEIGYWLSQDAQGKGIVSRCLLALLAYAFADRGMNRVMIRAAVENQKSRNIPERLGFFYEGIQREGELLVDGIFHDLAVYSILKKEFKA